MTHGIEETKLKAREPLPPEEMTLAIKALNLSKVREMIQP